MYRLFLALLRALLTGKVADGRRVRHDYLLPRAAAIRDLFTRIAERELAFAFRRMRFMSHHRAVEESVETYLWRQLDSRSRRRAKKVMAKAWKKYPWTVPAYAMTTQLHTDIPIGMAANALGWNAPIGQLDAALADLVYNVKKDNRFNAVGNGVADDLLPIQSAINQASTDGGGIVFLPRGSYRHTAAFVLKNFVYIWGAGMKVSKLQPSAQTFAVLTNATGLQQGFVCRDFFVDYSVATGSVVATNPAAQAFSFLTAPNIIGQYQFENIYIRYAYQGFNDTSTGYMGGYRNVLMEDVNTGFVHTSGTTLELIRVFVNRAVLGFNINGVSQLTLIGCAIQNCTGSNPLNLTTCLGLNIIGFDYEANTMSTANGRVLSFSNCQGEVSGIRGSANTIGVAAGTCNIVGIDSGSKLTFIGCVVGSDNGDTAVGAGGTVNTLSCSAEANLISLKGGDWKTATVGAGAPTVTLFSIGNFAGQSVSVENVLMAGTNFDPGFALTFLGQRISKHRVVLAYGAAIATDASLGNEFDITATNNTAFTISNPTNLVDGQELTYTIRNTSGGALGAVTWGAVFKMSAWVSPATANSRSITLRYDSGNNVLVEISRTPNDVPN